jgi:hypothetical protein
MGLADTCKPTHPVCRTHCFAPTRAPPKWAVLPTPGVSFLRLCAKSTLQHRRPSHVLRASFAPNVTRANGLHVNALRSAVRVRAPLWEQVCAWCETQASLRDRERSLLTGAVRYLRRHRQALGRFLEDARIALTNNACERALRKIVARRANWIFVGSDEDAKASAVFISLLASCRLHQLDSRQYLRDLFRVLPRWPQTRLLELHPRFWAWTRSRLSAHELDGHCGMITLPPRADLPRPVMLHEDESAT